MPLPDLDEGGRGYWGGEEGRMQTDDTLMWVLMGLAVMASVVIFVLFKKLGA